MGVCPLVSPEAEERPQGDTSSNAGGSESLSPRLSLPPPPLTPLAPSDTVAPFQLSASAIDTPPPLFGAQSVQSTRGNMYGPESSYTGAAPLITYYSVDSNLASPKFAPPQSSLMGKSSFAQLTPAPAQQFRVGPTSTNLRAPSMSAAPITYVQLNSESEQVSEPGEFHHQRFSSTAGGPPSLTPLGGLAFSLPESAEQGPMSSNEGGGFGGSNKRQA
ncbi:hypothetical protein BJ742DRAFT_221321 [Cladochytrium replicatum]|nr:hypothetical protein BJ742DRAFT_221321 [Cladochytrium replicatum]